MAEAIDSNVEITLDETAQESLNRIAEEARLARIRASNTYPGLINRQDLVNFCRSQLPALKIKNQEYADSIEMLEKMKSDHSATIHSLYEGMQENFGYQKALRDVCEWAKNHLIEENPIPLNEPVDLVTQTAAMNELAQETQSFETNAAQYQDGDYPQ